MDVTTLDGPAYAKFVAAGSYFLGKYRGIVNDLNVFPVPDGDTGTNMYLTCRQAAIEAGKVESARIADVAAAAAQGALMGARGNSGVIMSQMLRGFAHHVRHRSEIDTFLLATAMREGVNAAKQALVKVVEGTIISVAESAADSAYHLALRERDFYRFLRAVLRAANEALERTPDQLPVLKEAGVVDAGGAGFVYFLEGALQFLPEIRVRSTAFPRRPARGRVFTAAQTVGDRKFCTEFILEQADCTAHQLREALEPLGDSLIVAGAQERYKVHIHTDVPEKVQSAVADFGVLTRLKVDNMERQHTLLVVEKPAKEYSIVALVPGSGFEQIVRELGAEVTVDARHNPSVRDILLGINKSLSDTVYLLVNDANAKLAALEAAKLSGRTVHLVPTADVVGGIAALLALRSSNGAAHSVETLQQCAAQTRSAQVFFAGKDASIGGTTVERGKPAALFAGNVYGGGSLGQAAIRALEAMGARNGGLITVYYGAAQKERDAQRLADDLRSAFAQADVEYYYGGQQNAEFWISLDE
ncbi:MAG TPA: DAK2 domain-containing protein [Candidatus Baltobacteraceae bacterium]|nr:DAK2 domain-containing protein [Candidatus Baltobacteraceae bacterium]